MRHLSPPSSRGRSFAIAAATATLAASLLVTFPSPASAAGHTVDPSTLTPPPPDFFNASCREAGQQIICDLAFVDPAMPVKEPTGIVCGSGAAAFEVLDTSIRTVRGIRYYGADGLLLRRHFTDSIDGTFSNSVTGKNVTIHQQDTHLHDLATPGDNNSGVERSTGFLRAYSSNGTVLIDVGRGIVSLADGTMLFEAGQHPFDDYFNGDPTGLQPLCDELAT